MHQEHDLNPNPKFIRFSFQFIYIYFIYTIYNIFHKIHLGHQIIQTTLFLGCINIIEYQKNIKSQHKIHP